MTERDGYVVEVYTQRHQDSFKGPKKIREILSTLSGILRTQPTATIGNSWGMPLDDAIATANEYTNPEGYIPLSGHLTTSRGSIRKVYPRD